MLISLVLEVISSWRIPLRDNVSFFLGMVLSLSNAMRVLHISV